LTFLARGGGGLWTSGGPVKHMKKEKVQKRPSAGGGGFGVWGVFTQGREIEGFGLNLRKRTKRRLSKTRSRSTDS